MVYFILVRLVISLVILVILAVTAIALRLVPEKPQYQSASREAASPSAIIGLPTGDSTDMFEDAIVFESSDGSIQLQYPDKWELYDTTALNAQEVQESWTIQSFPIEDEQQGDIPEDTALIDFKILSLTDGNIVEQLTECTEKTVTCENIRIGNTMYKKATTILNTGAIHVTLAAQEGERIISAKASIAPGEQQYALHNTVLQIFSTISTNQ